MYVPADDGAEEANVLHAHKYQPQQAREGEQTANAHIDGHDESEGCDEPLLPVRPVLRVLWVIRAVPIDFVRVDFLVNDRGYIRGDLGRGVLGYITTILFRAPFLPLRLLLHPCEVGGRGLADRARRGTLRRRREDSGHGLNLDANRAAGMNGRADSHPRRPLISAPGSGVQNDPRRLPSARSSCRYTACAQANQCARHSTEKDA